jgi:hypothetical protein
MHTGFMFSQIRSAKDANPSVDLKSCWQFFNLGIACVTDFMGLITMANEARLAVQVSRQVECDGFLFILSE